MRILYLSNHDLNSHSGVVKKIKSQVSEWSNQGHEVYIFSTSGLKLFNAEFCLVESYSKSWKILKKTSYLKIIISHFFSYLVSLKVNPTLIYSRYFLYSPFLSLMFLRFVTIFEINGDDKEELRSANIFVRLYNLITRDFIILGASGFVFVSRELKLKNNVNKLSIVIPNGISVDLFSTFCSPSLNQNITHVGFSGTAGQNWHGIEKIVPFFEKTKDIHLHVVGIPGHSSSNITYYGQVNSEKNLEILSLCHVCISTLALHRKSMQEASPLKSREYISLGKRFIYAYTDSDLDEIAYLRPDLFLKLPNTEENVFNNWEIIYSFIKQPLTLEVSEEIKKIGQEKLIFEQKEKLRTSFFKLIVEKIR